MREQIAWFSAGAMLAAFIVLLFTYDAGVSDARRSGASDDARVAQRLEAIERTLGELLQREAAQAAGSTTGERRTDAPSTTTDEQETKDALIPVSAAAANAAERGAAIVDGAVSSGYWSRKNAQDFMAVAGQMSRDDQLALTRKLAAAINEDRVKVEAGVMPR